MLVGGEGSRREVLVGGRGSAGFSGGRRRWLWSASRRLTDKDGGWRERTRVAWRNAGGMGRYAGGRGRKVGGKKVAGRKAGGGEEDG